MINPLRRRITWLSIDQFNKVRQFETYRPRPTKKEIAVYSVLGINIFLPFTAFLITNPLIWKLARRFEVVR